MISDTKASKAIPTAKTATIIEIIVHGGRLHSVGTRKERGKVARFDVKKLYICILYVNVHTTINLRVTKIYMTITCSMYVLFINYCRDVPHTMGLPDHVPSLRQTLSFVAFS